VFDCDGVLVDSEPIHARATAQALEERGLLADPTFFRRTVGMRVRDQMLLLADELAVSGEELLAARQSHFWALVGQGVAAVPGSACAVQRVRSAGAEVAVATSGTRPWLDHVLDGLELTSLVDASVCGDDVNCPKPHPESYLRAAAALGLPPESCAAVEDSPRGAASAVGAGMRLVAIDRDGAGAAAFPGAAAVETSMAAVADVLGSWCR
jgi:beta-phosphoglucomutase-like phosphatase (HAD superfamily)